MAENEQKETTEIKTATAAESKKPAARKPRRRPAGKFNQAPKKAAPFSDSLADCFGDALANKLKRGIEEDIKRKIKAAQADPKVQKASEKFAK